MKRLLIFADVHGDYSTWMTIKAMVRAGDGLVIAGDLFDTRYGSHFHPDFRPRDIRKEILSLEPCLYYVYGNCDVPSFFPGHGFFLEFLSLGKKIFLHHGHTRPALPRECEIIIQGHTHLPELKKTKGKIFFNPGSITSPRNHVPTYGIMDEKGIRIMEVKNENTKASLDFL